MAPGRLHPARRRAGWLTALPTRRLSGIAYFLCVRPEIQARLRSEVDSSFATAGDITLLNVQHLKYLTAALNETLRIYPATASSAPRIIKAGGQAVGGYFLPANVSQCHRWPGGTR